MSVPVNLLLDSVEPIDRYLLLQRRAAGKKGLFGTLRFHSKCSHYTQEMIEVQSNINQSLLESKLTLSIVGRRLKPSRNNLASVLIFHLYRAALWTTSFGRCSLSVWQFW